MVVMPGPDPGIQSAATAVWIAGSSPRSSPAMTTILDARGCVLGQRRQCGSGSGEACGSILEGAALVALTQAELLARLRRRQHAGAEQADDLSRPLDQRAVAREHALLKVKVVLEPDAHV